MNALRPFMRGAAVLALVAAQAAPAQLAPGRSGSSTMRTLDEASFGPALFAFGYCYAERNRKGAFDLLATQPGTIEEAKVYKRLFSKANQTCLGDLTEFRVSLALVRGTIAEGLYKQAIPILAALAAPAPESVDKIRNLSDAARCYTKGHRSEVRALLATTKPLSKGETAAIDALLPEFSKCIPAGALRVAFDRTQLRYRLAEALLRLPTANTASAGND